MYEFCYLLLFMKKVSFLQMDQIHPPGFLATGKSSKMISVQNKRINMFFYNNTFLSSFQKTLYIDENDARVQEDSEL